MFKIILPLLLLIFTVTGLHAHTYTHDFGTIDMAGGKVSHLFRLAPSKKPVSILKAFPGCPCVKAEYSKQPYKAGQPVDVTFTLDPVGIKGHFTKSIYLRMTDNRRDTLRVTGTVTGSIETPVKKYPYPFGMGFQLKTPKIDLGTVARGARKAVTIPFANGYEAGMMLDLVPQGSDASMLFIPYGKKIGPMTESEFTIIINVPANAKRGKIKAQLLPVINGFKVDPVTVTATIK